jgi:beta-aspartyl-peptidase (threonine type)
MNFSLAIHGGAGTMPRHLMTPEMEKSCHAALRKAVEAGVALLAGGGNAMDAVIAAVTELENHHLFNAGRGSVFNADGKHHMDASVMDGTSKLAGAVAGIEGVKNPVQLAREVMRHSPHVLLTGKGAEDFARLRKIEFEDENYFFTSRRYYQYLLAQKEDKILLDHAPYSSPKGTVGAVARDSSGALAAATSTGGMTNKKFGRVGDTPIIGAGIWADNQTCAISCTGHGEFFIRQVVAHDIHCLMLYKNLSLREACELVVNDKLKITGGEGGLIAADANGNICMPFNSEGMYRGFYEMGNISTGVYREMI